jgi:hypothetical protein
MCLHRCYLPLPAQSRTECNYDYVKLLRGACDAEEDVWGESKYTGAPAAATVQWHYTLLPLRFAPCCCASLTVAQAQMLWTQLPLAQLRTMFSPVSGVLQIFPGGKTRHDGTK